MSVKERLSSGHNGYVRIVLKKGGFVSEFLVVVAGAQKCGTSTLYALLATHPEISASNLSETEFYTGHRPEADRRTKYLRNFSSTKGRWFLDVSPGYFVSSIAAAQISEDFPDARIIVILRDPVERAYSAWRMQVTKGSERKNFDDAVRSSDHYLEHGRYGANLRRIYERFSPEKVLVLFFDDLKLSSTAVLESISEFLEIAPFTIREIPSINVGGGARFKSVVLLLNLLYRARNYLRGTAFRRLVANPDVDRISRKIRNRLASWNRSPNVVLPGAKPETEMFIRESLREELLHAEVLTGRSFERWRP